ncbi:membrane protein [Phycicoccus endophyticus]|nr:membrane protein [Phycicoccus endophyticus]
MTLIRTMLERPLDPGYQAAADRRAAAGLPRSTSLRAPRLLLATLVMGLAVGVAAANLTASNTPRSTARKDLVREIEAGRAQADRLTAQAQRLQAQVAALEAEQLASVGADTTRSQEISEAVGAVPLTGPGLVLTLDDSPEADSADATTSDQADEQRILARDLQYVVNALWQSGAEAVSINGNRLTSVSAIRFAGSALIVDYRPLARPYVVTALGDPQELPGRFADGVGGSYVSALHSNFGIRADTEVSDDLRVPAAVGLTTRYATPLDTGVSPTSGATSDPEDPSS